MKVIDISGWQSDINWKAVKEYGVKGVIVKIGQGIFLDSDFIQHINDAVVHGFRVGVYHYSTARNVDDAIAEAERMDEWIRTYLNDETPELGIWYDVEDNRVRTNGTETMQVAYYTHTLYSKGYTYVGVYANYNWLTNIINIHSLPSYIPYWVAQYSSNNDFKNENPNAIVRMWQYSDTEYIFNQNFDINNYYE